MYSNLNLPLHSSEERNYNFICSCDLLKLRTLKCRYGKNSVRVSFVMECQALSCTVLWCVLCLGCSNNNHRLLRRLRGRQYWGFSLGLKQVFLFWRFPQLFETLAKMSSNDRCFTSDLVTEENGSVSLSLPCALLHFFKLLLWVKCQ